MGFRDRGSRPYRKHNPLPALIVIGVLGFGALCVWGYAILNRSDINDAIRCSPAAAPPPGAVYTSLDHEALDGTLPIPPDKVAVKVLNAGGTRGQAGITTATLKALGFSQTADPQNDPAYPESREATCRGQIRFGENGTTAARTLSLLAPCMELVKDNRQDATVDLAIGSSFRDFQPKAEAREILDQLNEWSRQHQSGGGEQSTGPTGPSLDQTLLASSRDVSC